MPYELVQRKGWTPKEAFADIRHLDYPWQMYSFLKHSDVASDIEDFEWDNIPIDLYLKKEGGGKELSGSTNNKRKSANVSESNKTRKGSADSQPKMSLLDRVKWRCA